MTLVKKVETVSICKKIFTDICVHRVEK